MHLLRKLFKGVLHSKEAMSLERGRVVEQTESQHRREAKGIQEDSYAAHQERELKRMEQDRSFKEKD